MSSSPSHRKVRGIYTTTLDSNYRGSAVLTQMSSESFVISRPPDTFDAVRIACLRFFLARRSPSLTRVLVISDSKPSLEGLKHIRIAVP